MSEYLAAILALLTAIAGWFYLFYSRAAQRLENVEDERINRKRIHLRRGGGLVMLLLSVFFFAGFFTVDSQESAEAFLLVWLAVFVLLGTIVVLALMDLRLTLLLRQNREKRKQDGGSVSP